MGTNPLDFLDSFLNSLGLTSGQLIGLDIGQSAVKAAVLVSTGKNQFKLQKFGHQPLPEGVLIEDEILRPEEIQKNIVECLQNAGIHSKNVCIGLSGSNTTSRKLQLAEGKPEEIEEQVMWESEQYIPFGIDDSVVSYSVMAKNDAGGLEVMMAAARSDTVNNFKTVVMNSGLKVKVIDLHIFALANLFEFCVGNLLDVGNSGVLVIDFGAQKTNILVFKNNIVIFTREVAIGGMVITEEIQRQMGLSYNEAEDLKVRGDEKGNLPEEILPIINSTLESFFIEIKKNLNFFMSTASEVSIDFCYVTGGTALTPGLIEGLESSIGIEVRPINPFETISYDQGRFDESDLDYIASCGAVALGLAMRKLN